MGIFLQPWRRYADFEGRSRRGEYGAFYAVLYGTIFVAAFMTGFSEEASRLESVWGIVAIVIIIAGIVPSWALKIRRLHDQGRSGWWALTTAIPYLGWIATIVIGLLPGTAGENDYGPDPRDENPDADLLTDIFS